MNRDEVWRAIDAARLSLTAELDRLSDDEWHRPSLCEGWTVRQVAGHVCLHHVPIGTALAGAIRARGDVNRMIHDLACRHATRPTAQLVAEIRGQVGSRRHPPGVTYLEVLADVVIHGYDMLIPLGRDADVPPAVVAAAADRIWALATRRTFGAAKPFPATFAMARFRLAATDTQWTVGAGETVEGPIDALLLVLAGRLVALPRLSGARVPELADRLAVTVGQRSAARATGKSK